jgi:NAD(P)-dependent dehydrogenase (short-subunit alcohol dehydrogenase family)
MQFQNASALVSGGASGLGEFTVRRLAAAGMKVLILDRDVAKGSALAKDLGDAAAFAEGDVTEEGSVASAVEQAQGLAPLRVAVSCAGVGFATRVVDREGRPHPLDIFRKILEINLIGTFNVLRFSAAAMAANEPLEDNERGVVVNTASAAAFDGQIGQSAYAASKGGVVSMTLAAARDLAAAGIRVVTIAPGTFDTPLLGMLPEPQREKLRENIPFPKRLGQSDEFAALVEHIVANRYINGETIRLDGALRMPPR